jgi:hypothetical protein
MGFGPGWERLAKKVPYGFARFAGWSPAPGLRPGLGTFCISPPSPPFCPLPVPESSRRRMCQHGISA